MYRSFYKLDSIPFRLTPDPRFFYASESHERGLAYLHYALQQRTGLVVVSGDPGSGKTELISKFSSEISSNSGINFKIMSAHSKKENLLDRVFALFLNRSASNLLDDQEKLKALQLFFNQELRQNTHSLLVIDEANNLSIDSLSILSQLAGLRTDGKPLLQCFLLGQQPLLSKLELPKLKSLQQQVLIFTHLDGLDLSDTRGYIEHRLTCSGWKKDPAFDEQVFIPIYQFTHGVPRTINALCSRILVECCLDQKHQVDIESTARIINEMQQETIIPRQSLDLDFSQYGKTEMASTIHSDSDKEQQKIIQKVEVSKKELVTAEVNAGEASATVKQSVDDRTVTSSATTENATNQQSVSDLKSTGSVKTDSESTKQKASESKSTGSAKMDTATVKQGVGDVKSTGSTKAEISNIGVYEKPDAKKPSAQKPSLYAKHVVTREPEKAPLTENNQYIHQSFMPARSVEDALSSQTQNRVKNELNNKTEIDEPASRGVVETKKVRHRESGLLDKDLRALASCLELPAKTGQNNAKQERHNHGDKNQAYGTQKPNVNVLYDAIRQKVSPKLKNITENAQRKIPFLNKIMSVFPISYTGVIVSVSILIVFWFFIYGPGVNLTMSVLKYFASLAGH